MEVIEDMTDHGCSANTAVDTHAGVENRAEGERKDTQTTDATNVVTPEAICASAL